MTPSELIKCNFLAFIIAKQSFLMEEVQISNFENAANTLVDTYLKGGRLYIAGNGGSAADAKNLAAKFVG